MAVTVFAKKIAPGKKNRAALHQLGWGRPGNIFNLFLYTTLFPDIYLGLQIEKSAHKSYKQPCEFLTNSKRCDFLLSSILLSKSWKIFEKNILNQEKIPVYVVNMTDY